VGDDRGKQGEAGIPVNQQRAATRHVLDLCKMWRERKCVGRTDVITLLRSLHTLERTSRAVHYVVGKLNAVLHLRLMLMCWMPLNPTFEPLHLGCGQG